MVYFLCKAYDSDRQNCYFALSLPVRGAWVEMEIRSLRRSVLESRSPCGERGLKYRDEAAQGRDGMSLPVRGAWVEIQSQASYAASQEGRSPCGERGLKCHKLQNALALSSVAPRAGSVG